MIDMNWIIYGLIFLAVCVVYFFITRIWIKGIDLIVSVLKKIFRINKNDGAANWHTLEDIRDKNREDSPKNEYKLKYINRRSGK